MREALARSHLDFSTSEPADEQRAEPTRLPKILRNASLSTACVIGGVIVVNALFLQDRRHPAPLLRAPDPAPLSDVVALPAPLPAPRPTAVAPSAQTPAPAAASTRGASRDPIADEIARAGLAERKPVKPTAAAPPTAEAQHRDAIAGLIGTTTTAAPAQPAATVLSAQKSLLRLGYVVKPNGVYGTAMRQAIEHFEKDNKLPVKGELTPKLARMLTAKSGASE